MTWSGHWDLVEGELSHFQAKTSRDIACLCRLPWILAIGHEQSPGVLRGKEGDGTQSTDIFLTLCLDASPTAQRPESQLLSHDQTSSSKCR